MLHVASVITPVTAANFFLRRETFCPEGPGPGDSVWGMSGQCVPQENLTPLGSNSSCLASTGASSANKVTRAVAG